MGKSLVSCFFTHGVVFQNRSQQSPTMEISSLNQGRGDGPKASTSWESEAAQVKAELDCATLWVCFAYIPKP